MNKQLTELLTNYGPVGAIWFDGIWDQPTNFNWQLEEQYALIHKLQPSCLIATIIIELLMQEKISKCSNVICPVKTKPVFQQDKE